MKKQLKSSLELGPISYDSSVFRFGNIASDSPRRLNAQISVGIVSLKSEKLDSRSQTVQMPETK